MLIALSVIEVTVENAVNNTVKQLKFLRNYTNHNKKTKPKQNVQLLLKLTS